MSFARPAQPYRVGGVPLVPMIDLMFVLVIFFVTTMRFQTQEQQIDMKLPVAQTAGPAQPRRTEVIVNVKADGSLIVGDHPYELGSLQNMLGVLVKDFPDEQMILRGDKQVTYERIIEVMDAARSVGIRNIYFATVKKGSQIGG